MILIMNGREGRSAHCCKRKMLLARALDKGPGKAEFSHRPPLLSNKPTDTEYNQAETLTCFKDNHSSPAVVTKADVVTDSLWPLRVLMTLGISGQTHGSSRLNSLLLQLSALLTIRMPSFLLLVIGKLVHAEIGVPTLLDAACINAYAKLV